MDTKKILITLHALFFAVRVKWINTFLIILCLLEYSYVHDPYYVYVVQFFVVLFYLTMSHNEVKFCHMYHNMKNVIR